MTKTPKSTEISKHTGAQAALKSGLSLGHRIQDILETYGIENSKARRAAHTIAEAVVEDLKLLGQGFVENGHEECAKALLFEAEHLFSS